MVASELSVSISDVRLHVPFHRAVAPAEAERGEYGVIVAADSPRENAKLPLLGLREPWLERVRIARVEHRHEAVA